MTEDLGFVAVVKEMREWERGNERMGERERGKEKGGKIGGTTKKEG